MEIDGEGGGGEAERRGRSELGGLLLALGSEVLEKRIPLIKQLEELSADDLDLILQVLLASWVDSTCSGVSHCALHKSILQVALKCSDLDITEYLAQFLTLAAKASSWCVRHLQCSVKSIDQSQVAQEEEHHKLSLEVNSLSFVSTKLYVIAAKYITVLGLEVAAGEDGQGAEAEGREECVLNKVDEEFPALETVAVEVERAPAHLAVGATPLSLAPVLPPRTQKASRRKRRPSKENGNNVAVLVEVPLENGHDMAMMAPRGLAPVLPPRTQKASRRCTHCAMWIRESDGPGTLCNACGQRLYKRWLLRSNSRCRRGPPSKKPRASKENGNDVAVLVEVPPENGHDISTAPRSPAPLPQEASRRCTQCASENTRRWLRGPDGPATLCSACGQRFYKEQLLLRPNSGRRRGRPLKNRRLSTMENSAASDAVTALVEVPSENGHDMAMAAPRSLAPLPQEASRSHRCTQCASEKTRGWRRGPDGPATLCDACGQRFYKAQRPSKKRRSSSKVNSAASEDVAALVGALPCGVGASLDAFFDRTFPWMSWEEEAGPAPAEAEEEEELEWLSNKDAFPSVETMAVEVEEAPSLDAPPARRARGRPPRVTANAVQPRRRRCTHCGTEETPHWRKGPEGPRTLCDACGVVFKEKGRCYVPDPAARGRHRPLLPSAVPPRPDAPSALPWTTDAPPGAFDRRALPLWTTDATAASRFRSNTYGCLIFAERF